MKLHKQTISLLVFCIGFIIVSTCYVSVTSFEQKMVVDALCMLLSVCLLVVLVMVNWAAIAIAPFEYVLILLITYIIAKNCISGPLDIPLIGYLLFLLIVYFGCKQLIRNNRELFTYYLFGALVVILFIFIIAALYYWIEKGLAVDNMLLQNKSIFSMLLASQIALCLPLWLFIRKHKRLPIFTDIFSGIVIGLAIVLLVLTNGRAGWLGLIVAVAVYWYAQLPPSRTKKIYRFVGLPLLVLLLVFLIQYKPGSSEGRLLIYKVSTNMLGNNWLFGIGSGQFKAQYNHYQAAYFEQHNINNKEALLADNTFYAFNDFWQFVIENGITGLVLLLLAFCLFVRQYLKQHQVVWQHPLFVAALASIICITVGAFLSYPLQVLPIVFHSLICLATISACMGSNTQHATKPNKPLYATTMVYAVLGLLVLIPLYKYYHYTVKSAQAYLNERAGFKQEALDIYQQLNGRIIKTGPTLFQYARCLYYTNQPLLAKAALAEAKKYYQSNDMYKLAGQIEMALHHDGEAEKAYQTAVYMVPNRMVNRYDLLLFYEQQRDTVNMVKWANAIASMPVKVPSDITRSIQKKVQTMLQQYK